MNLLLDTHIYLWWDINSKFISDRSYELIHSAEKVYISSISIWEIALKVNTKKLNVDVKEMIQGISENNFLALPLTAQHILAIAELPNIHKDPFDQILIAQSLSEPLHFLTADKKLESYSPLIIMN